MAKTKLQQVHDAIESNNGEMPVNQIIPFALGADRPYVNRSSDEEQGRYLHDFTMAGERETTVVTVKEDEHGAKIAVERLGEETGVPLFD